MKKNIFEKAIILIFSFFVIFMPLIYFFKESIFNILCYINFIIVFIIFVLDLRYKKEKYKFNKIDLIILLLPTLFLIPIITKNNVNSLSSDVEYVCVLYSISGMIIILRKYMNKYKSILLNTILISTIFNIIFVITNIWLYNFFDTNNLAIYFGDFYPTSIFRNYGTFGYPNSLGLFYLVGLIIDWHFLNKENNKRIIYRIFLYILLFGILTTLSKTIFIYLILINIYTLLKHNKIPYIEYVSAILPLLFVYNYFRIYIYTSNILFFLPLFILSIIVYLFLTKVVNKNKLIFSSIIIVLTFISFLLPLSSDLVLNNKVSKERVLLKDIYLEQDTNYEISFTVNKKSDGIEMIKLYKLYQKDNNAFLYNIANVNLADNNNKVLLDFKTDKKFEYYCLYMTNFDKNYYRISNIVINNKKKNEVYIEPINYYNTPYLIKSLADTLKYDRTSVGGRIEIYKDSLNIASHNLLTGQGFNTFKYYYRVNNYAHHAYYPHSFIFQLLLNIGLIGVIYVIYLIGYSLLYFFKNYSYDKDVIEFVAPLLLFSSLIDLHFEYVYLYIIFLFFFMLQINNYKEVDKKTIIFIASAGGHLTELLKIKNIFKDYNSIIITEKNLISKNIKDVHYMLYCSRYYIIKYLLVAPFNIFLSLYYFIRYNPDLVYTTGAHTSVPMCYLAYLFNRKVMFVEVYDRIITKTLSGKLVYPIANTFIVQHKESLKLYRRALYMGSVY